jgi:hypothetical protein
MRRRQSPETGSTCVSINTIKLPAITGRTLEKEEASDESEAPAFSDPGEIFYQNL